jgi:hypothetical protein
MNFTPNVSAFVSRFFPIAVYLGANQSVRPSHSAPFGMLREPFALG